MPTSHGDRRVDLRRGDDLVVEHDRDPALRVVRRRAGGGAGELLPGLLPEPLKSMVTYQPPSPCGSSSACAPSTPSPVSAGGPSRRSWPVSSGSTSSPSAAARASATATATPTPTGSGSASATPSTGWKLSCAVRPITSAASRGSCRPGSSTMIRRSPERVRVGSATPSASTRRRSTSTARSVDSLPALTVGESWVSRTIWVPPRRSSPRRAGVVTVTYSEPATIARAIRARTSGARDTGGLRRDHGAAAGAVTVGRECGWRSGGRGERGLPGARGWCGRGSGERERGWCAVPAGSRRTAAEPAGPALVSGRAGDECRQHEDGGQRAGRHRAVPCTGGIVMGRRGCLLGARATTGHGPGLVAAARADRHPAGRCRAPWRRVRARATRRPWPVRRAPRTPRPAPRARRAGPQAGCGFAWCGAGRSPDGPLGRRPAILPAGGSRTGQVDRVSGGTGGRRRGPGRARSSPG